MPGRAPVAFPSAITGTPFTSTHRIPSASWCGWAKVDLGQGGTPHAEGGFGTGDGKLRLHAIHNPGHTPGSISFRVEGSPILFSGDTLFPGGPVAQGCRLAGLKAPAGAVDRGFGSVA